MAKIKRHRRAGEPAIVKLKKAPWPAIRKPMRAIASVRTLRKVDEAVGRTMPESKIGLARPGVGTRQQGARIVKKTPALQTRTGSNRTVVSPPSPTNRGGVRSPFRKGRGTLP